MVSATTGDGLDRLLDALAAALPEGPFLYPPDELTDMPDRLLAAEIVREQIFLQTHEEVPYGTTVETESWQERKDGSVRIEATIYVARAGQKAILIGEKGSRVREIGARARSRARGAARAARASLPQREGARRLGRGARAAARDRPDSEEGALARRSDPLGAIRHRIGVDFARLTNLADGIFAVAMTFLAFSIQLPPPDTRRMAAISPSSPPCCRSSAR